MRLSLLSVLVLTAMIAVSLKLNFTEHRIVTGPYTLPGAPPTVTQGLHNMVMEVHYQKGWPIWYAKHTDTFHAPNAPCWLDQDRWNLQNVTESELDNLDMLDVRHRGPLILRTHWFRVLFNMCSTLLLGLGCSIAMVKLVDFFTRFNAGQRVADEALDKPF